MTVGKAAGHNELNGYAATKQTGAGAAIEDYLQKCCCRCWSCNPGSPCALWWIIEPTRIWDQCVALVLVCCPCAFGLARPLVATKLLNFCARERGLFIRDTQAPHALSTMSHIFFDKTGTLTEGKCRCKKATGFKPKLGRKHLPVASAMRSSHPCSQALAQHLNQHSLLELAGDQRN